ncbi:dipeptidase [Paenibacillus sp. GCM10023252]|uniref:dipeptidase n=1 Tax=Paenibacillus sp. GCM10023252 TaxID=3252649 RepID=UPI00360CCB53
MMVRNESTKIADFHCDVLYKLLQNDRLSFSNPTAGGLDVTYERLEQSGASLQTFAIYIPSKMDRGMVPILESIDLFHRHVLSCPRMKFVRNKTELQEAQSAGQIAALLSLEGVDGLQGSMAMLRILHQLGIRAAGLTWNHANWAADGVMEARGGGLTNRGKQMVEQCHTLGILLDVSHLSERGFWEMADLTHQPLIASHSNAKSVCPHPRNLTDQQLKAIIAMEGLIGITYVPYFVSQAETVTIDDVLLHIDYICGLGGERHLMLGSDFDGIDTYVSGLTHPGEVYRLKNALFRSYSEQQANAFLSGNAMRFLSENLPD